MIDLAAVTTTKQCGSEPARDGGVSDTLMLTVLSLSRAGSLPQGRPSFVTIKNLTRELLRGLGIPCSVSHA